MPTKIGRSLTAAAGTLLLVTAVAACGATPAPGGSGNSSQSPSAPATSGGQPSGTPTPTTPPAAEPVVLSANVKDGASKVTVDTLVKVKAKAGKLTKVKLSYSYTDQQGQREKGTVRGALSKDGASWTAAERLEPSGKYKLTMVGRNADKETSTKTAAFTTHNLSLDQQTFPTFYPLKGSKVGIGMPVVLNFDVPVKNKAEFEKNLQITTSPTQAGTWRWFSDTEVRYRPKEYWEPGTRVTVKANLNGVNAGNGVYGQNSAKTSFTVGRSFKIRVNLASDVATVYKNGKKVRTIYVSGGKPGWATRSGIKLIMAKEYNKKMTNEMIGAKEDYSLTAAYAMRITNSGEFLHSAPWNTAHFGRRNASHGCVGMSNGDAGWLINQTLIGDPVITTGSSKGMEDGNGYSDWNLSYKQYKKGSAL